MNTSNNNPQVLSIFVEDSISLVDRVTFDSCTLEGVQVTFWMEPPGDSTKILESIFDMIFDEMFERGNTNQAKIKSDV